MPLHDLLICTPICNHSLRPRHLIHGLPASGSASTPGTKHTIRPLASVSHRQSAYPRYVSLPTKTWESNALPRIQSTSILPAHGIQASSLGCTDPHHALAPACTHGRPPRPPANKQVWICDRAGRCLLFMQQGRFSAGVRQEPIGILAARIPEWARSATRCIASLPTQVAGTT